MTDDTNDCMECQPSTSKENLSMEKDMTTCSLCQDVYVDPCRIQCCGKLYCRLCLVSRLVAQPSCPACSTSCPATGFGKWILPDSTMHLFVLNSLPLESAVAYNNKLKFCNELQVKGKLRNIELELAARSMVKWADHVMLESDGRNIELRIRVDAKVLKPDQSHEEPLYIEDEAMVFVVEYNMQARVLREFLKERIVKDENVVINIYTKEGLQIEDSAMMHQILLDSGRSDDGRVWIFCDFVWKPLSELIEDMPVLEKECYETEAPTLKSMLEEPVLDRNNMTPEVVKMNNDQMKVLQRADSQNLVDQIKRNSFGNSLPRPEDFQPLLSAAEAPLPQFTANQTPPKTNGVNVANHPVLAAQLQQPSFSLSPQGKKRPAQSPMNGGKPAKIMNSTANLHNPLIKSALEGPTMSTGPALQVKAEPGKPVTPASASNGFGMVVNQARAMAPGMTVSQAMAMSKNMASNKGNGIKNGQNPFLLGALKGVPALNMQNKASSMNPSTGQAGSSHSPVGNLSNGMPMLSLPSPSPFHSASSTPSLASPTVRKHTTSTPSPMSASPNANMALFQQMLSQQMPNFAAFNPIMLGQLQLPQLYQQNLQALMQNAQFPGSIFPPQLQKPKKSATVQPIVRSEASVDNDKLWQMYNSTDECKKTINQTNVAVSINQPGSL